MCASVCIPWAGAGALSVHDTSTASSGAVRPLRPGWPLAVHCSRTMLSILNTLTPPTPLKKRVGRKWKRRRQQKWHSYQYLSVGPGISPLFPGLEKCPAPHLDIETLYLQPKCTHTHAHLLCSRPGLIQAKPCTHTHHRLSLFLNIMFLCVQINSIHLGE